MFAQIETVECRGIDCSDGSIERVECGEVDFSGRKIKVVECRGIERKGGVEFMREKFQGANLNEPGPPRGSGPLSIRVGNRGLAASPAAVQPCAVPLLPQIVILRSLRNIGKEWRYPTLQPLPPACLQSPLPAFLPSALSTLQCVRLEQRNRGRELASCDRLASIGRYTIRVPVFLIALTPSAFTT